MPKMLIDGRLVEGPRRLEVVNPATGEPFDTVTAADEAMVHAAADAAGTAFPAWSATPIAERRELLLAIASRIDESGEELARLLTAEQGKPLKYARYEVALTAEYFRYVASSDALKPVAIEDNERMRVELHRRPLGVVACIVPWNFPLGLIGTKVPAALLAGNCVVVKPSSTTPISTLRLGELVSDIAPAGVINVIVDKDDLGDALTAHPAVRQVSFTGSVATGRKVMSSVAPALKRVTLELGGNDAAIVLDDVDPDKVAPALFQAAFFNTGQVCVALKRLYVHDAIYDRLVDRLTELADAARVGDGMDENVEFGPVHNIAQFHKVRDYVASARLHGTITTRTPITENAGYFVRPVIVRDITDGCPLVDEEQFGPILPVIRFTDPEDALNRANASDYGLAGSVWSSDSEKALRLASRLEAGTVWVNKHVEISPSIPFGGAKSSGLGLESGELGIIEFTQAQVVNVNKHVS